MTDTLFQDAKSRLLEDLEAYFPGVKKDTADGWRLGDTTGKPGTSLHIASDGVFFDHQDGSKGDVLDLYRLMHGLPSPLAAAQAILGTTHPAHRKRRTPPPPKQDKAAPSAWPHDLTPAEAGAVCNRKPADMVTIYRDTDGLPLFAVCRWNGNGTDKKKIRPIFYTARGWTQGLPAGLETRPLLDQAELVESSGPVLIVEGEKCCLAARSIGINATTWTGGAVAARLVDVGPLAGRDVTLWPDHDEPGRKAMETLAGKLRAIGCRVRTVTVPADKPAGWDLADCIETEGAGDALALISGAVDIETPAPRANRSLTDMGNAERLADRYADRIRWNAKRKAWLVWTGKRWEDDLRGYVTRAIVDTVRAIPKDAAALGADTAAIKAAEKFSLKCESYRHIKAVDNLARDIQGLAILPEDLDTRTDELNTPAGVVDLRTGEITPHDPAALHTRITKTGYKPMQDPLAAAPRFHKFLADTFQTRELAAWVQEYLGYACTGRTSSHVFAVFYGKGANGKSTLLDIVSRVAGDYVQPARAETFMHLERRSETRNDLAALRGARLVIAQETDNGRAIDAATIKAISAGDPITCRHLYGEDFTYTPTFKALLVTNHKPRIAAMDDGIRRRLKLVPFKYAIPANEQILDLAEIIAREEGPAVLAWLVEGARRYFANGQRFTQCEEIEYETSDYLEEEDILGNWLTEIVTQTPGASTSLQALYESAARYAVAAGVKAPTKKDVSRRLKDEGHDPYRPKGQGNNLGYHFRGLTVTNAPGIG